MFSSKLSAVSRLSAISLYRHLTQLGLLWNTNTLATLPGRTECTRVQTLDEVTMQIPVLAPTCFSLSDLNEN